MPVVWWAAAVACVVLEAREGLPSRGARTTFDLERPRRPSEGRGVRPWPRTDQATEEVSWLTNRGRLIDGQDRP